MTEVPTPPWVAAVPLAHRDRHRRTFVLAGAYNVAWGGLTIVWPQWLFDLAGLPPANHPQVFATLGMVIGLYGVVYLGVAAHPEHGGLGAAVGLAGKVLGPIGLTWLLVTGTWPLATVVLCLTNDVIWWVPFARYLVDLRRATRSVPVPYVTGEVVAVSSQHP